MKLNSVFFYLIQDVKVKISFLIFQGKINGINVIMRGS